MNIFDSYIEAGQQLNKRDREQYYTALIEFIAYDVEPNLKGAAAAVFTAIRPSLGISKTRANSGRVGGKNRSKASYEKSVCHEFDNGFANDLLASKTEANGKANGQAMSKSNSNSKEELPNGSSKKAAPRFVKPSVEEVSAYASELGVPYFDASHFVDYYESNGWKVGRNGMKDWKATVRNWARKDVPKRGASHVEYD